ncbi:phage major capsid protein [Corynebacterium minutissimum]|uniref:Putative phage capsid protein n=1 Tax=Corynebacterium minutissimum TaxID=38301 RepID=A0A376CYD1_9CORY|nr:phage major capsid protein [Corynebacterium minutissimum]QRP60870.1 phage major capsid protein [Corynebacterium minutissimum]STC77499.1 putative phage capsid protein [Corynebacterium minutissimum]
MRKTIAELKAERDKLRAEIEEIAFKGDSMSEAEYNAVKEKMDEVKEYDAEIADRVERDEMLKALKQFGRGADSGDPSPTGETDESTLGGHFVKSAAAELKAFRPGKTISYQAPEFKAASDPSLTGGQGQGVIDGYATEWSRAIVNQRRERLVAADLMGSARLTQPVIKYLVEKLNRIAEGGPEFVAEGAKKPYVRYSPLDLVTESPAKIAALTKVSDEMLEDLPFIADYINNQLVYDLSVEEEKALLNGDGQGSNLMGLFNREGIQSHDISGDPFDGLLEAIDMVALATPLTADGIMLNPADYQQLRKKKDNNGQYLAGGPFQGQYGNNGILLSPAVWGLSVVSTPAVEQGTYMVGAFRQGATILRRGGLRVDSTNTNVDDFENNLVTLRAEERLGLMVPRPAAFVTGKISGAGAAADTGAAA